jgi:DNA-binding response OmpR family regulator
MQEINEKTKLMNLLKQLTVLFADDDQILRETIGETLGIFFKEVILAINGQDAYSKYIEHTPHVVILDISMPLLNGLTVAQQIRETDKYTPILIMTSYKEESQLLAAIKLNLVDYLIKPVKLSQLSESLQACAVQLITSGSLLYQFENGAKYDALTNQIKTDEGNFTLTKNERFFINFLLKRRGQLVRNDEILTQMSSDEDYSSQSLRNLIYRLRKKLGKDVIISIKDLGYLIH